MSFSSDFIANTLDESFHEKWAEENSDFLNSPHAFLSSFPRSGNGWFRLILAATFLQPNDIDVEKLGIRHKDMGGGIKYSCLATEAHEYSIEEIFPDIYHLNLKSHYAGMSDSVKSLNIPVKLIKTHHVVNCNSIKTIFLFREPLSCLTSAALYFNKEALEKDPLAINSTIHYLVTFYSGMLSYYLDQSKKNPQNILFVSHESLIKRGISEVERVFNFLDINIPTAHLEKLFQCFPFKSTYEKSFENYMTHETKEEIAEIHTRIYEAAKKLATQK